MKNRVVLIVIAVVALLATVGPVACSGQKTAVQPERISVTRGDIVQTVEADGELSLPQQRKLSFGISGKIDVVNVEEGAKVTKGQKLAKLDTASVERAVKAAELAVKLADVDRQQAEAAVQAAQADLKQAENGVKTAEADRQQAEYGVKSAEANLKQAENGVLTAVADLDMATNSLTKISYPYTITTFKFDIPAAIVALHDAQLNLDLARGGLGAAPGTQQYVEAWDKFNKALDSLKQAQGNLLVGTGIDAFLATTTQSQGSVSIERPAIAVSDYWTLKAAQLAVDKARLGVGTARGALSMAQIAVDTAKSVLLKAQLSIEVANVAVDKARAGLLSAQGVLSKAQLGVDKAKYDLETARDTLDDAAITAPFDGVIAQVDAKAGDVLTPMDYGRPIFQLIDSRHMEFTIRVDEMDILGVELGQEASVSIDAVPGLKPKGKVVFVSPLPTVEGGVVQYEVKIGFDVPEGSVLKAGMSSSASITTARHNNILLVPNRAISRSKSGQPAVRLLVNGQIQERVVETGISNTQYTEIISGLNEGDTVVPT